MMRVTVTLPDGQMVMVRFVPDDGVEVDYKQGSARTLSWTPIRSARGDYEVEDEDG